MTSTAAALQARTRDPRAALDRAVAAMGVRRRAEVEVLEAALVFAHAHVVSPAGDGRGERSASWTPDSRSGSPSVLWGEQAVPLAGPGAPLVGEFAPVELSAALEVSHEAALALIGDVLDLAHRLPRLWGLVRNLRVPVHLARRAAQECRDLSPAAADHADRLLVWEPRRLNPHRVGVLVHEARLYADPDRAIADHALADRRVEVHHELGAPGTSQVFMTLDTADAVGFDRTVSTMATTLGLLGHPAPLGPRRAHAVGILADPQRALDLLAADPMTPTNPADSARPDRQDAGWHTEPDDDPATCVAEEAAYSPATPFSGHTHGGRGKPDAVIVLHVTDRDLLHPHRPGKSRVATCDKLGPVLLDQLARWLPAAENVTICPVLDPTTIPAVDTHDPPPRMAEAVRHRDTTCVFPHCHRPSQRCDLDHIDPYVPLDQGGPPGQTHPDNLAPLCRRHHRAKTFAHFTYQRMPDGSYRWTLPTGTTATTAPPTPRPTPDRSQRRRQPRPPC